jgi:hypothetical protein
MKMQGILQRCRWDFVIRSFKAVKSNHDRELTMERFQKRRYVPLSNLTDSKKWVSSGQQSNSFKNTQNIKSIMNISSIKHIKNIMNIKISKYQKYRKNSQIFKNSQKRTGQESV